MTEWQDYNGKDKHQKAFEVLKAERSVRIVHRLGLGEDATVVRACLNCHALPEADGFVPDRSLLEEGVTCVACHGPFSEWATEHQNGEVWRAQADVNPGRLRPDNWFNLDRKKKELNKGMTDLWDPVRRAEVCASCHVGNFQQKKLITHAMYAAGHPPLPSFETAAFSNSQPRHWQYLREKDPGIQKRLQPFDPKNMEQAELVAVTGLVVFRELMKLYADQAKASPNDPPGAAWPDLARYDCRACHHELRSNDEGPLRPGLLPGRPAEPPWAHALVRLAIEGLAGNPANAVRERKQYESLAQSLHEGLSTSPFGDRARTIEAMENISRWADKLLKSRRNAPVDCDRAWVLLHTACTIEETTVLDYESARQRAWASRAIYQDLLAENSKANADPAISEALDRLDAMLLTKLPLATEPIPIEQSIKTRLQFAAQYNQSATRDQFQKIRQRIASRLQSQRP